MTTTLNTLVTKHTATEVKSADGKAPLSPFAQFQVAFRGYSFFDIKRNKLLTKTQVYFIDPILAIGMAITENVDKRYKLVDSLGWSNGTLNS